MSEKLAFPCQSPGQLEPGMSLRDWFAGQALPSLVAQPEIGAAVAKNNGITLNEAVASTAYGIADAMLKARDA